MNYLRYCYVSLFLLLCAQTSFAVNSFTLQRAVTSTHTLNRSFSKCDTIDLPSIGVISGLSISGQITKNSPEYTVRIVLTDNDGHEYLVLESYEEICSDSVFSLSDYCEETALLASITPRSLSIYLKDASLRLDNIYISTEAIRSSNSQEIQNTREELKRSQSESIVNKINAYNRSHNRLWRAAVTPLSKLSYSEKRRVFGFDEDSSTKGFEYYAEGIYELGNVLTTRNDRVANSPFINDFSWSDRHGKNWMTSVKNQYETNTCYPFTVVACVEAMVNLYYNQKIDLDLSEQELAYCSGLRAPYNGTYYDELYKPLVYFKEHGVCDESSYPFDSTGVDRICRSSQITPNELVTIGNYIEVVDRSEDSIKHALIHHGPLITGIVHPSLHHSMVLVGYGTLQAGDSVYHYIDENGNMNGHYTVHENDPRIGQTVYIYKNSGGLSNINNRMGYYYFITPDFSYYSHATYYCTYPFTSINYTDNDIVCEDSDNDGYYFWGIGPKPANCPVGVPDIPDGDDSNPELGPMDEYGNLQVLRADDRDTIFICANQTTSAMRNYVNHIVVCNNAIWTVKDSLSFYGGATITVRSGSTINVQNSSCLNNIELQLEPGATININGNAHLNYRKEKNFYVPTGTILNMNYGLIEL